MYLIIQLTRFKSIVPMYMGILIKATLFWVLTEYVMKPQSDDFMATFHSLASDKVTFLQTSIVTAGMSFYTFKQSTQAFKRVLKAIKTIEALILEVSGGESLSGKLAHAKRATASAMRDANEFGIPGDSKIANAVTMTIDDLEGAPSSESTSSLNKGNSSSGVTPEREGSSDQLLLNDPASTSVPGAPFRRRDILPLSFINAIIGGGTRALFGCLTCRGPEQASSKFSDTPALLAVWLFEARKRSDFAKDLTWCATLSDVPAISIRIFNTYAACLETALFEGHTQPDTLGSKQQLRRLFMDLVAHMYNEGDTLTETLVGLVLMVYFVYMPTYFILTAGLWGLVPILCATFLILTPYSITRTLRHPLAHLSNDAQNKFFSEIISPEIGFIRKLLNVLSLGWCFGRNRLVVVA